MQFYDFPEAVSTMSVWGQDIIPPQLRGSQDILTYSPAQNSNVATGFQQIIFSLDGHLVSLF